MEPLSTRDVFGTPSAPEICTALLVGRVATPHGEQAKAQDLPESCDVGQHVAISSKQRNVVRGKGSGPRGRLSAKGGSRSRRQGAKSSAVALSNRMRAGFASNGRAAANWR